MKKIVFATVPMKKDIEKQKYSVDGNALIESKEPICYAVNPAVTSKLTKEDEVSVILLKTNGGEGAGEKNVELFKEELNELNNPIGAKIEYKTIQSDFDLSTLNFQDIFKKLIRELKEGAEIYADVTFGPKPLAFLLFSVMQFGEKFFDCSIGNIVYSKVEFGPNNIITSDSGKIYDITPLYLLNTFTNVLEASSSERALQAMNAFLEE